MKLSQHFYIHLVKRLILRPFLCVLLLLLEGGGGIYEISCSSVRLSTFLEQETLPSLLSSGWWQEQNRA